MKAVLIRSFGGPDVLSYEQAASPAIQSPSDIVVAVKAASINAADVKVRRGDSRNAVTFPHILGRDFSGMVVEAGPDADLKVGDAVVGVFPHGVEGGYAERVALDAKWVARKPDGLSHVQAAAIGLAGMTACDALETLGIQKGESLLVQGGAGGVGGFAVLVAHLRGVRVVTTARTVNHEYVRGLGADQAIDYTQQNPVDVIQGCDAVLDTVGSATIAQSFAVLRSGGRAAFIASGPAAVPSPRSDLVSLRPAVHRGREVLERVFQQISPESIAKVEITTTSLGHARQAHERSESRRVRGKLVLTMDEG